MSPEARARQIQMWSVGDDERHRRSGDVGIYAPGPLVVDTYYGLGELEEGV
ncbi:MAG: hypothetical protein HOV87_22315 [Catenulispora sp.]|nr:hypothetical protein [Catenulispora sp.]